jgi:diguanylate cyclase (GGDEF)-like protein
MSEHIEKENKELKARVEELEGEIHRLEGDLIHDHLTGLKTRKFFEEESGMYLDIISQVEDNRRKQWFGFRMMSVILFDVDFFKKVNDTYGHQAGDEVLKVVSLEIKKTLREGDTASRWGGEEMIVLLIGAGEEDAKKKAEEIRLAISELKFSIPDLKVSISAGVASSEKGINLSELTKRADDALYQAKESGRNKVIAYSEVKK